MPAAVAAVSAAASAVAGWFGGLGPVAQFLVQAGAGAALSAAGAMLAQGRMQMPKQEDIKRELAIPRSLPYYRYVYGRAKTYGSPAPWIVKDDILYGALILNSRPSAGGSVRIQLDKRVVELEGDLTDLSVGATGTNGLFAPGFSGLPPEPNHHTQFWLALGQQVSAPPQIVAEAPELFQASDAWRGCTVLWCRLRSGGEKRRIRRWPRVPPEVEVTADWSRVWDPRVGSQDPDDPSTWGFRRNQALVLLDLLMCNPVRPYPIDQIDLPMFIDAAHAADEAVALKSGGSEPRYRADGVVVWNGAELADQVAPIAAAGAAQMVRAGGRVGMIPGVWRPPQVTISDVLGDEMAFDMLKPGRDLAATVTTTYVPLERDSEPAALVPYTVPGAVTSDGGDVSVALDLEWVSSGTQAMRVQKIEAMRQRAQGRLSGTFPPSAFALLAGSAAQIALPAPFEGLNGVYAVETISPQIDLEGDGVALRCPAVAVETGPEIYYWSPAEDEQDLVDGIAVNPERPALAPPALVLLSTGASVALDTGDGFVPRILVRWDPSLSARVGSYEVVYRIGSGAWHQAGIVDAEIEDGDGRGFFHIAPVQVGASYAVRVRALAVGDSSDWVTDSITAAGPEVVLTPPTGGIATGDVGQVAVSFVAPNDSEFLAIEFWASDMSDVGTAILIAGPIYGAPNATYGVVETGLGGAVTRHYWARSRGAFGAASSFSSGVSATTS